MSSELVRAARAEEQRLLRELQATPLFRRLEKVRALLSEYGEGYIPTTKASAATSVSRVKPRSSTPRANSLTARVIAGSADYLRERQRRAQSGEILQALKERGIEVTGQKPAAVVASILSPCDQFDNVGGEGYGLVEWDSRSEARSDVSGLDKGNDLVSSSDGATSVERPWPHHST